VVILGKYYYLFMARIIDHGVEIELSPVGRYKFKSGPFKIWKMGKES
jgi:hypothetical protein